MRAGCSSRPAAFFGLDFFAEGFWASEAAFVTRFVRLMGDVAVFFAGFLATFVVMGSIVSVGCSDAARRESRAIRIFPVVPLIE